MNRVIFTYEQIVALALVLMKSDIATQGNCEEYRDFCEDFWNCAFKHPDYERFTYDDYREVAGGVRINVMVHQVSYVTWMTACGFEVKDRQVVGLRDLTPYECKQLGV